jgi:glycosyltransferase involved in cell wall biosynthesis
VVRRSPPSALSRLYHKLGKAAQAPWRRLRRIDRKVVTLLPQGRPRGRVLFSFILDPFLLSPGAPLSHAHTHDWESRDMARAWVELGYAVDVISWQDDRFTPRETYAYLVDVRYNLERLAPRLNPGVVRILHADTAELGFHNRAEARRLEELARRRGVRLRPRRQVPVARGIDVADAATVLGNHFTIETYAAAGKPMYRVPISSPLGYDWPEGKDFAAAARRFVWFGSGGMVHKGLDLVLEAFAGMPELELDVCGPVENETDFAAFYRKELYATPNIRLHDWVDVAGGEFRELCTRSIALVYPTCSEGGGGSVLTCMHASLIPVVTREASVDLDPSYGVLLEDVSVEGIRAAARGLAGRPPETLGAMARAAWEFARANHTRERFAAGYRDVLLRIHREVRART